MGPSSILRLAVVSFIGSLAVGCLVENNPPPPSSSTVGGTPVGSGSSPGGSSGGAPSANPMLVDVDPNVTMNAQPGDGVGVFTEYTTGGHWHVWWTCDTSRTSQPCAFDVRISVAKGIVSNAKADQLGASDTLTTTAGAPALEAATTTSLNVNGVFFDTDPGAVITIDASIGGLRDGSFLFFVQKGQVNGGFTGKLTDPLMLEGATP